MMDKLQLFCRSQMLGGQTIRGNNYRIALCNRSTSVGFIIIWQQHKVDIIACHAAHNIINILWRVAKI